MSGIRVAPSTLKLWPIVSGIKGPRRGGRAPCPNPGVQDVEGIEEEPTERWSRGSRKVLFDGKASPPYDKARGMDGHGGWDKRVATSKNVSDMSRD